MSDDKKYDVGYGKPPQHTRFKPGQSGNPKGRPKKVGASISETFWKEINTMVIVTENGKSRKISKLEAMAKRHSVKAINGDPKSTELCLRAMTLGGVDADRGLADLIGALDAKHESHEVIDAKVIPPKITNGKGDAEN